MLHLWAINLIGWHHCAVQEAAQFEPGLRCSCTGCRHTSRRSSSEALKGLESIVLSGISEAEVADSPVWMLTDLRSSFWFIFCLFGSTLALCALGSFGAKH